MYKPYYLLYVGDAAIGVRQELKNYPFYFCLWSHAVTIVVHMHDDTVIEHCVNHVEGKVYNK